MYWYIFVLESTDGFEIFYGGAYLINADNYNEAKVKLKNLVGLSEKRWRDEISIIEVFRMNDKPIDIIRG